MKFSIIHKSKTAQALLKSNTIISYVSKCQKQRKIQMVEIKTYRSTTFILEIIQILLNELVYAHWFHTHSFPMLIKSH